MNDEVFHDYLAVGCAVDARSASCYVRRLLDATIDATQHPVDLLCRIIEDATIKGGHGDIVIPLSGGHDSRGLLGAALQVVPATAIHCIAFGTEQSPDMIVATETCARLGLEHERVDPNIDIPGIWNASPTSAYGYGTGGGRSPRSTGSPRKGPSPRGSATDPSCRDISTTRPAGDIYPMTRTQDPVAE